MQKKIYLFYSYPKKVAFTQNAKVLAFLFLSLNHLFQEFWQRYSGLFGAFKLLFWLPRVNCILTKQRSYKDPILFIYNSVYKIKFWQIVYSKLLIRLLFVKDPFFRQLPELIQTMFENQMRIVDPKLIDTQTTQ